MYLKSLELTGFKSFARRTALEFNTPITAIVGPNGSGKSNVAEAFRFVLGEQSIKSMRGKRTEDLIWNGSPEMGRSNRASVKLFFDNRRKLFNLDFDEVILERVIYRDSSSEYLLNGSQVRLRDIVELLSGAHIGVSGHHIISQGEADRILNASMKERREMIEDALGLKIYQWKRGESERKLLKTEENMKQVEGLRKEIAPHLTFLKKQVDKLEKMKAQKEELSALYREYLARERAHIVSEKRRIEEEERGPKQELSALARALSSAKKTLGETHGQDLKAKAVVAIAEKLNAVRMAREELSRDLGRLEGEIAALKRLAKADEGARVSGGLVPVSEIEAIARETEEAGEESNAEILRRAFEKIRNALRALAERYRQREHPAAESVEKEMTLLFARKKENERKLAAIQREEQEAIGEERKLRTDIEEEKDSSRDAEKEVFRIMARQNELQGILNGLQMRARDITHLEEDFKRELSEGALLVGRGILEYEKDEALHPSGYPAHPDERTRETDRISQEERRRKIEKLKIRIEDAGAGGGAEVLKEFEEANERDRFLASELADLEKSAETLRQLIAELGQKLDEEFCAGIEKINGEFLKFFSLMFGGGSAELAMVKPEKKARREMDELLASEEGISVPEEVEKDTGIEIEINLPRKKIKGLMMLSGGERALTSIALLFAMSQVNPPPFLVLDETDAALDEANSRKYGDMVENLAKHSQLILITHNRETMSRAGVIYGITMDKNGVSKLLSIAFNEAIAVAK